MNFKNLFSFNRSRGKFLDGTTLEPYGRETYRYVDQSGHATSFSVYPDVAGSPGKLTVVISDVNLTDDGKTFCLQQREELKTKIRSYFRDEGVTCDFV